MDSSNFGVSVPTDMPRTMSVGSDYAAIGATHGVTFAKPYPQAAQPGSAVMNTAGPATTGEGIMSVLAGLGGPFQNPQGFAEPSNPIVGGGVNLHPAATSEKGAFDITKLDPRTWFPGVMTLFHSTRVPGKAESSNVG
jgi:hypothetical protein